jgi:hypothetical protein
MEPEHPEAEIFRQARTSILTFAWIGLVSITLLGLGALALATIALLLLGGHEGAWGKISLALYLTAFATCIYGGWTFLHLLRCGQKLTAGQDIDLALEHHRRFWQHGAILSGLMLAEVVVFLRFHP